MKAQKKLRLVVRNTGRVPEQVTKHESFSWVSPKSKDQVVAAIMPHEDALLDLRRVNFEVGSHGVGVSIRGGKDLGLGIYISAVDPDSPAAEVGLTVRLWRVYWGLGWISKPIKTSVKAGDQICDVNGIDFDAVTHEEAVHILKSNSHLFLTVKSGGAIPQWVWKVEVGYSINFLTTGCLFNFN